MDTMLKKLVTLIEFIVYYEQSSDLVDVNMEYL